MLLKENEAERFEISTGEGILSLSPCGRLTSPLHHCQRWMYEEGSSALRSNKEQQPFSIETAVPQLGECVFRHNILSTRYSVRTSLVQKWLSEWWWWMGKLWELVNFDGTAEHPDMVEKGAWEGEEEAGGWGDFVSVQLNAGQTCALINLFSELVSSRFPALHCKTRDSTICWQKRNTSLKKQGWLWGNSELLIWSRADSTNYHRSLFHSQWIISSEFFQ